MVHSIPGRVRFRVPSIAGRPDEADGLSGRLRRLAGVTQVSSNPYCASLTIHYDPGVWTVAALRRRLRTLAPKTLRSLHACRRTDDRSSWYELSLSSFGVAAGWTKSPLLAPLLPVCLAAAAVPMMTRAYDAFAREGRLTVDVLDASAAAVLCVQGQWTMAMFMMWLINLGDYIRDATVAHARSAVTSVLAYQQSTAWVVRNGRKASIPVLALRVGDRVVVHPGDRIPIDGTVLAGAASVDEQTLTGESVPRDKQAGDRVFAATVVRDGTLHIRASQVGNDTEAAKTVRLVEAAPAQETTMQNYAERWANDLVPYSFLGAGLQSLLGGARGAASVLVIDYGTGIRVAAPTAVLATMAEAVRHGVLFKGGRALESLAAVDAVVFDKTGTLSVGTPQVTCVRAYGRWTSARMLALAASAEGRLNHPVAQAIAKEAMETGAPVRWAESSRYTVGLGVAARVNGSAVHVGCLRYMEHLDVELPDAARRDCRELSAQAVSPVCVAVDGAVAGIIGCADRVRPEARRVIERLRRHGVSELAMVTGDQEAVARRAAAAIGIDRVAAELLPGQKVAYLQDLQRRGFRVAVVGDGINDSPALAHADVGIALRGGADVAQESAHVVMLNGTLEALPLAFDLARDATETIRDSWRIISVPNTIALTLALCGGLGPGAATLLSNGAAIVATGRALQPLWRTTPAQKSEDNARRTSDSASDLTRASRMTAANG